VAAERAFAPPRDELDSIGATKALRELHVDVGV